MSDKGEFETLQDMLDLAALSQRAAAMRYSEEVEDLPLSTLRGWLDPECSVHRAIRFYRWLEKQIEEQERKKRRK